MHAPPAVSANDSIAAIDWSAPWLCDWRVAGEAVATQVAQGQVLHQALNHVAGAIDGPFKPPEFVAQAALPAGEAYESFIHRDGRCPTRDNLHDFFNGVCWLQFPQTKRRLNRLQADQIARQTTAMRGPVRDAITVFDENGAVLDAPAPLWRALLARDWRALFVTLRPLWREARLVLFGHALQEKLIYPRKTMVAHVYIAQAAIDSVASMDSWLAHSITDSVLAAKPFTPLPVLGVPGWWRENENFSFYDDSHAFRPRRAA